MIRFSVNLNKVALVRNTRDLGIPSVLRAARICLEAGAHGITVHPRPDGRHIRPSDVRELLPLVREHGGGVELNIEGYPTDDFLALVLEVRPDQCTLVPDAPEQRTSDHGWNVAEQRDLLTRSVGALAAAGIRTSLFMDGATAADVRRIAQARDVGAARVELYTEPWAKAHGTDRQEEVLTHLSAAAHRAHDAGLGINAGHDLNLANLPPLVDAVPQLEEVSIGHAFITDALEMGYAAAVRAYLAALEGEPDARARAEQPTG